MSLAQEIADQLLGTCDSEPDELLDMPSEELAKFDGLIFRCNGCGWWCEAGEAIEGPDGEDVCGNCASEEDNE